MRLAVALLACLLPGLGAAQEFFTLKGHGGPIMGIAVGPRGQIATASFDNSVGLWSGRVPRWLEGNEAAVNAVVFGAEAICSAGDDFTVRCWSGANGSGPAPERIIGRHKGKVVGLATAPGLVASASWDGTIGLWPTDGTPGRVLGGHDGGVNAVAFSADHRRLYSASMDGTLRLWDVASGRHLRVILRYGFGINEIALNHAAGWLAFGTVDGVTRVIEPDSGAALADLTLGRRPILALALSPDGSRLAVGDGEGYIMIIDTATWQIVRDFRATLHGPVWALAWSDDGRNIHAGGLDDAMYSWPVADMSGHEPMAAAERSFLRDPAKMGNGERQFARKCSICHALSTSSARRAGPSLHGLFGRRAGTVTDYRYSDILDGSDIVWDDFSIDALFDLGPDHYIPGTKMPMQRITDPADRKDLIAFLRRATSQETGQ